MMGCFLVGRPEGLSAIILLMYPKAATSEPDAGRRKQGMLNVDQVSPSLRPLLAKKER